MTVDGSDASISFVYDGNGDMIKETDPNGDYTLHYFGFYEEHYNAGGSRTGTTQYYPAGGAMRVTTDSPETDTLYFILSDHLGSTSVITNSSGIEVGRMGYYPFGETRYSTGSLYTDKLYTGQQQVAGTGLYNYKARFYDPYIIHFAFPP